MHPWQVTPAEGRDIQKRLAPEVSFINGIPSRVSYVAGLDISPPNDEGVARGAVVVLGFPDLEVVEV